MSGGPNYSVSRHARRRRAGRTPFHAVGEGFLTFRSHLMAQEAQIG